MVVLGKVAAVFLMVLIGYGAGKMNWLPIASSKYLSTIVINIAAPCVVIYSMGQQELNQKSISTMFLIFGLAFAMYILAWLISIIMVKIMKVVPSEQGVYKNFLIFTNNAFMGFPVAYALFGSEGMFLMVLANVMMPIFVYTLGIHNLRKSRMDGTPELSGSRLKIIGHRLREMVTPPVVSTLVGLVIFIFQIPIPGVLNDVFDMVGATMAPLCMIVIGLQLTESSPKQVMTNHKFIIISIMRLIVIPAIVFLPLFLFKVDPLVICIMTLNAMLPCSAICVALAQEYKNDVKLAAEGTFLTTLFSVATIPVIGVLLTTFIL